MTTAPAEEPTIPAAEQKTPAAGEAAASCETECPPIAMVNERFPIAGGLPGHYTEDQAYPIFTFNATEERSFITTTMNWYVKEGPYGHGQSSCKAADAGATSPSAYGTDYVAPNGTVYSENSLQETYGIDTPNLRHARSFPWAAGEWAVSVKWCGYQHEIEVSVLATNTFLETHPNGTWT